MVLTSPVMAQSQTSEAVPPAEAVQQDPELVRAQRIADNARQEVERLRAELALKDELIALGIERNAELYAIALEVIDKGLNKRSIDPFLQTQRVRMENLTQDYVDRAHAARIYPGMPAPSEQQATDPASPQSN
ncbi:hypothetical protein L288_17735 [Sphingobium quisquiliarum P25]|uniref:Uncharacterized protein n=2 Tax=Sphingobium quisquiliarum TaxID=538379 RepID=T0GLN4_9SPHN|nr:hypothetical protein L288_17735 [Sphingobium quisquiliarum P25]